MSTVYRCAWICPTFETEQELHEHMAKEHNIGPLARQEYPHASDCGIWVGENCGCVTGGKPRNQQ